jgi:diguanylate cyclase (GGDEF)-like protein/PAS domain S-box-containing protein
MTEKILTKQRLINPWHFLWLSVVFSELFTASLNTVQSFIWYGKLLPNLLIIGALDAMFVPLIVAPIVVYFMKYTAELKKFNEQLQQEIIHRKHAEASRQESEAQYRALFEGSPDAILLADPETGIILDANAAASRLLVRPSAEIAGLHQSEIHPSQKGKYFREAFTQHVEETKEQKGSRPIEHTVLRPDGTEVPVEVLAQLVTIKGKKVLQGVFRDITERKKVEQKLDESIDRFRRLSEAGFEGIIISEQGVIVDANTRMAEMLACKFSDLIGSKVSDFVAPESLASFENHIRSVSEERYELFAKKKEGAIFPVEVQGKSLPYEGRILQITAIRDITERKEAEEQIRYLAYYDSLTGLPNRTFYRELVSRALLLAKRHHWTIAILFIDLDYFKRINDTLGHDIGDQLLRIVGDLVKTCIRQSDFIARSEQDELENVVARLGGDEFIVLLNEIAHSQDASRVARRILKELARPFTLAGHEVFVTASIGIALYPLDGNDSDDLLKNADVAMYHAKNQGRNNYQFYTKSMNATSLQRLDLENDLRKATDRNEFVLYYQPTVDIRTKAIIGAEALVRWDHPEKGMISPAEFIPLAEETGLIVPIGKWVLRSACIQNKAWQDAGNKYLRMSVNLSSRQFDQEGLIEVVSEALRDSGFDPRYLELEITESTIMKNPEKAATTLQKLKDMGICLSIDDFGTGYSSLGNLRRFPLDSLKIDRSFVTNITTDSDDAAIITAIIAMARSLKLRVIAEGVEAEEQQAFLRDLGCHEMQGYLFSRPLPVNDFFKLL